MVGSTWKAKMAPGCSGAMQIAECAGVGQAELAEQNLRAGKGGGEHVGDHAAGPGHGALADSRSAAPGRRSVICRPRPQATVRQRMCLRSVEPSHAASKHGQNPQHAGESTQSGRLLRSSGQAASLLAARSRSEFESRLCTNDLAAEMPEADLTLFDYLTAFADSPQHFRA